MTREDTLSVEIDLLRRRLGRLRDGAIDLADGYALPEDEEHPRERRAALDLEPRPEAP